MAKAFILLTSGRAGSTSLMDSLAVHQDIALPRRFFDCVDDELLHPQQVNNYAHQMAQLVNAPVTSAEMLIRLYFQCSRRFEYSGFKSMPNRHRDLQQLVNNEQLQIITLTREDIPSTVASFQMAMAYGTWRRQGQTHHQQWRYDPANNHLMASNIRYVVDSRKQLLALPGAIHLNYESMCSSDFVCPELDQYFQRPVRLQQPIQPVHGSSYVANWEAFASYVNEFVAT